MAQPITWLLLAPLLVVGTAAAQPQLPSRHRQDRRVSLPTTPTEPLLELYVAANNLTTVVFNAKLDPDSLVVDRTRFKWAEVSDHLLMLEPFADVGERLIVQVGFKDRALPAKAVIAVVSRNDVMDGKVEVDRRANTPEALLAALTQKEAELEELKARFAGTGPVELVLSEWLTDVSRPIVLIVEDHATDGHGLKVNRAFGYESKVSALVAIQLSNLPGQKPWALEHARITDAAGTLVKVLTVKMKQSQVAPGEEELVVVEVKTPPWATGKTFSVELVGANGQRRLSINLIMK
jgi:uncharacterized protein (TIGR02268 family)